MFWVDRKAMRYIWGQFRLSQMGTRGKQRNGMTGTRKIVPVGWYQGTRRMVPGYQENGISVPGEWYQGNRRMVPGEWYQKSGTRRVVPGEMVPEKWDQGDFIGDTD